MWILVMFLITSQGPNISAYPKPFADDATCQEALVSSRAELAKIMEQAQSKMPAPAFACVQMPAQEKAE